MTLYPFACVAASVLGRCATVLKDVVWTKRPGQFWQFVRVVPLATINGAGLFNSCNGSALGKHHVFRFQTPVPKGQT